ncbi:MAG: hypothetical protein IJR87_07415 [Bacteroidaceae bacterium]|nr:hypothetical protein [Bacteroidaceae bacterium]
MLLQQGTLAEHAGNQIHRVLQEADIYFVVNQEGRPSTEKISCPRSVAEPELWDPYTGEVTLARGGQVQTDGKTEVTLRQRPGQSMFVVFNCGKSTYRKSPTYTYGRKTCRQLDDVWDVVFEPKLEENFSIPAFRQDSRLQPAGLVGPVSLMFLNSL